MKKRLSKSLAHAGVASRRACEELIFSGRVTVNKQIVIVPETLVDWNEDRIEVDGKRISGEEKKVYFMLNKPAGFLCTQKRPTPQSKLVLDLFSGFPYRLFTVGRLDRETMGLIIITNDGHFANTIQHPSFGVTKEYLAKVEEEVMPEHLEALSAGTIVEGVRIKPLKVKKVRKGTLKIVVGEGRKHEVRLLLKNAGLEVIELWRIRVGPFTLGALPLGQFRTLSPQEIDNLAMAVKD